MNRLIRQLAAAGLFASTALTSLIAFADGETPRRALFPAAGINAVAPRSLDDSASADRELLAQAEVAPPAESTDEDVPSRPAPLPSRPDATGPLPPTNPNDPANASEPPNPSEYSAAADTDPAALTDFRDTLSPYGSWVDDPTYGTVWVPAGSAVGSDFTPYVSNGHWGLTEEGSWNWVSDYSWGWAPFHYGRWVWVGGRGWSWIPGRVYSPAWVVWRTGYYDDYYVGWAPMPPTWYWSGGAAVSLWYVPPAPYVFCSSRYVFAPHVRGYIVPAERVGVIGPRTSPYVAASAGVASGTYRYAAAARGPTMADAHIPAAAMPATRVSHDPRALAFSHATLASRPMASRPFSAAPTNAIQPSAFSRPPSFAGARPLPSMAAPRGPAPVEVPRPVSPSWPSTRTYAAAPAPVTRPAPVLRSAPTFSPPQRSFSPAPVAPRSFSPPPAPARSFSAPVVRSAPSPATAAGRGFGGARGRR